MDITLSEKEVFWIVGVDVSHAVFIADDFNWLTQTRHRDSAARFRKRLAREPKPDTPKDQAQDDNYEDNNNNDFERFRHDIPCSSLQSN
jgi:hypothetical protein